MCGGMRGAVASILATSMFSLVVLMVIMPAMQEKVKVSSFVYPKTSFSRDSDAR